MRETTFSWILLGTLAMAQVSTWSVDAQELRSTRPNQKAARPNIVILYADDMGYGDLGIQNPDAKIPTPHLDQLAREGLRFTDAHSSSGICTPSRYALLTGRYHWRKFHNIVRAFGGSVFSSERLTLPEMLRQTGYRTACVGKWHLGWDWDAIKKPGAEPNGGGRQGYAADAFDWTRPIPDGPLAHGFDYYFGDDVPNFPPYTWIENDRVLMPPTVPYVPDPRPAEGNPEGRPGPMVSGWRQDQVMPRLTEKAVAWIERQRGSEQPFFLYFPWTSPHAPIVPTTEFQGSTNAGGYGDFVHQSDWTAGQILEALDQHGFRDNTLVIFTSDNGPERYAYERVRRFHHRSMGPLRGLKRDIWEGGHRVPLLIRWPGVVESGRVSEALASQVDVMATIAAIIGFSLPTDAAEDSHDLLPLLKGEPGAEGIRTTHVHNTRADHYAMRQGDWLLIDDKTGAISRAPEWYDEANGYRPNPHDAALYNLRDDLAQRDNLLERFPTKVAELRTLLAQVREQGHSAPRLAASDRPSAGQGIMVGEVTPTSALVQVRLTRGESLVDGDLPGMAGVVEFSLTPVGSSDQVASLRIEAGAERDFIARAAFDDLRPGMRYECKTRVGATENSLRDGPLATFKTLSGAKGAEDVRFVVVTGMNYAKFHGDGRIDRRLHLLQNNTALPRPYAGPDKYLGYPGLVSILQRNPDFFVGTGDNVYYDTPTDPKAESISEMRRKWHEQFAQPRYHDLFAAVPTYWMIDDHDYRVDDCDNTGQYEPTPEMGRATMLEQLPVAPHEDEDAKTYRTHRASRDLQVWFPENRMYRSPNKTPDGPGKTIWGAEQKAWLKRTLRASDATYKLLISPTPMVGPDDRRKTDNHTNIGGFRHERDEFFAWLKEAGIDNFYILCGDRHWQYHSIHASGIEEFSCGALVDANSRLGRKPGDPQSTDPEGNIRQPYYQSPRSGGFLLVEVTAGGDDDADAKLAFQWYDELGQLLHQHVTVP